MGLVVVQLEEQFEDPVLELVALGLRDRLEPALVLVADVVTVDGLVADDQADHVGSVGELGPRRPVHRQVEARVEQERLEQRRGGLALERVVALVVVEDDLRLALQVLVLLRPAEGVVDLAARAQRREDLRVALGVHRLHERDVRQHRFLVRGDRIRDERDRADRALDGVEQRQAREDPHRQFLLVLGERAPRLDVVGHGNLLREPEVAGEAIPDLGVLVVGDAVPVDRGDAIDEFDAHAVGRRVCCCSHRLPT